MLNIGRHLVSPHKIFDVLKVTIEDDWSDSIMIVGIDKVNDRGDLWENDWITSIKEGHTLLRFNNTIKLVLRLHKE
jgi:hypothetical protein